MLESKPETLLKDVGKQTLKRMSVEIPSGLSVATGAPRTSVHKCVWGGGGANPALCAYYYYYLLYYYY